MVELNPVKAAAKVAFNHAFDVVKDKVLTSDIDRDGVSDVEELKANVEEIIEAGKAQAVAFKNIASLLSLYYLHYKGTSGENKA